MDKLDRDNTNTTLLLQYFKNLKDEATWINKTYIFYFLARGKSFQPDLMM